MVALSEYARINLAYWGYCTTVTLTLFLWERRHRIGRAIRVWCRPDLNPDTPRQYVRGSRRHHV